MATRRLQRLEQLAGRRRPAGRGEWTAAGAVHDDPEHILAVLRGLRDAGALEMTLAGEELELALKILAADEDQP